MPRGRDHRVRSGRRSPRSLTYDPPALRSSLLALNARGYSYPDGSRGLGALRLEIIPGEIVALLGPNGCGKTTTLRLVCRQALARGEALVAAAFDTPPFLDALTGRENLVDQLRLRGEPAGAAREAARSWLEHFGLSTQADRPVRAYSFGTRRRLALAEAFAAAAPLTLLDEPLSGLDLEGRNAVSEALRSARARGGAVLAALHDPVFAEQEADRVLFIDHGVVIGDGPPSQLIGALSAAPRFWIECEPPSAGMDYSSLPAPLERIAQTDREIELSSPSGASALPEAIAWLVAQRVAIRRIEVREAGLADVFFHLTGQRLDPGDEAGATNPVREGRNG